MAEETVKPEFEKLPCTTCQLEFSNQTILDAHMSGSKHQKKILANQLLEKLTKTETCFTHDTVKGTYTCLVCNIELTSPQLLEAHFSGNKHKQRATGGDPAIKQPAQQQQATSNGQASKRQLNPAAPPAKRVTGAVAPIEAGADGFKCKECDKSFNSDVQMTQHLASSKHRNRLAELKSGMPGNQRGGRGGGRGGSFFAGRGGGRGGGRGRGRGNNNFFGSGNNSFFGSGNNSFLEGGRGGNNSFLEGGRGGNNGFLEGGGRGGNNSFLDVGRGGNNYRGNNQRGGNNFRGANPRGGRGRFNDFGGDFNSMDFLGKSSLFNSNGSGPTGGGSFYDDDTFGTKSFSKPTSNVSRYPEAFNYPPAGRGNSFQTPSFSGYNDCNCCNVGGNSGHSGPSGPSGGGGNSRPFSGW